MNDHAAWVLEVTARIVVNYGPEFLLSLLAHASLDPLASATEHSLERRTPATTCWLAHSVSLMLCLHRCKQLENINHH